MKRSRTILAAVDDGSRLEREAGAVASRPELEALQDVHSRIANFLPRLENLRDDESVAGLGARLAGHRESLRQQIHLLESKQVDLQRLTNERQQFEGFRDRYNQALFHDTRYTGLDLPDDQAATRRAAVAALKVYGAAGPGDNWALGSLPVSLSPSDRAEIAGACYELLLVLSQAEATPEGGLERLDQAARLHPAPTRAYHFRRAVCLERAGDRQGAGRERLAAEGQPVATALDHYLAGQERYRRNEPIAAIRHFDEALRQQPGHFWAHCLSAICWLQLGDPPAARAGFTACLDGESGRGFAWLYILRGLASSRGLENARPEEMRLRSEAAEADYRRAMVLLEAKPNDELRYVLLVNRGLLRYQRGDLDAAVADLEAAIRLGDLQSLASTALADVFRKQGRYTEAFDQFSRAIAHRPDWAPLYRFRADVVLEIKAPTPAQRAQALSDLDRAIRLEKPDNRVLARDHTRRGRLLAAEGRDVEALAACDAAIEQVRDYEEAHRLRLDVLLRLKRHDDVIRSCDALIAGGKASAAIYERRALARELSRDLAGAIEDFTSAMALGGDRPKLLRRRGWAYIVADSPRLALHDFQEAIRRDPSNADAYTGRGLARLRQGEHREAIADAEKALSLGETTADLTFKAARVYALAAIVVTSKARKNGQESVQLVGRYQERAAELLRQTIRRLPPDRRTSFVSDCHPQRPRPVDPSPPLVVEGTRGDGSVPGRRGRDKSVRSSRFIGSQAASILAGNDPMRISVCPTRDPGAARRRARRTAPAAAFSGCVFRLRPRVEWMEERTLLSTFLVGNTDDSGPGSLRQAILDSNAAVGATNTIDFDIAGSGVQTIFPLSSLPAIVNPVLIDGFSQPGYAGTPLIEIDGSQAGAATAC